jgi:hypothetical protein
MPGVGGGGVVGCNESTTPISRERGVGGENLHRGTISEKRGQLGGSVGSYAI